jgi:hypothetical protein
MIRFFGLALEMNDGRANIANVAIPVTFSERLEVSARSLWELGRSSSQKIVAVLGAGAHAVASAWKSLSAFVAASIGAGRQEDVRRATLPAAQAQSGFEVAAPLHEHARAPVGGPEASRPALPLPESRRPARPPDEGDATCWTGCVEDWLVPTRVVNTRYTNFAIERNRATGADKNDEVGASFVHVDATWLSILRGFSARRPGIARVALWSWFGLLLLGEGGATWAWLRAQEPTFVCMGASYYAALYGALACLWGRGRAGSFMISASASLLPAASCYAAVLLISDSLAEAAIRDGDVETCILLPLTAVILGCIEVAAVGAPYLAVDAPGGPWKHFAAAVEIAHDRLRTLAALLLWLSVAAVFHALTMDALGRCTPHGAPEKSVSAPGRARGKFTVEVGIWHVVLMHAIAVGSREARRRTRELLGDSLLPRLFGELRAERLRLRALIRKHGPKILRSVPFLRSIVPPPPAVAVVVAIRRTTPLTTFVGAVAGECALRLGGVDVARGIWILALVGGVAATAFVARGHIIRMGCCSTVGHVALLLPPLAGLTAERRRLAGWALRWVECAFVVPGTATLSGWLHTATTHRQHGKVSASVGSMSRGVDPSISNPSLHFALRRHPAASLRGRDNPRLRSESDRE